MAQEIGVAYVSLLPSGKGFSKGVQTEAESAFKGAEKSSDGFFSKVVSWAKTGAVVVGGMVTAVGALALGGGISRALNIEDATAKLKGLGHDTQTVEQIMKDALASVKGTAFGLDSAATQAASAVAAGIKPGQELERYLRLVADSATIAGGSMDDLGRVFNNVTTLGAAYNDSLQILAQKGLPIYQWLADEIGTTTDEVKKLASEGKVSAETFRSAIENNIAGAALSAGDTTRGSFANMISALSRLGEAFAGPAIGAAKDFFTEITKVADGINSALAPAFADLQFWVDGLDFKFSDDVLTFLTPLLDTINEVSAAAREGSLREWFMDLASLSPTLSLLVDTAGYVSPLLPLFKQLGERVGPVLADAFKQIAVAVLPLIPLLAKDLTNAIIQITPPLADLLVALLPIIPPLLQLIQFVLPVLTFLISSLAPVISTSAKEWGYFFDVLTKMFGFLSGNTTFPEFVAQLQTFQGTIGTVIATVLNFELYMSGVMRQVVLAWRAGWSEVQSFFASAAQNILNVGASVWNALPEGFRVGVLQVIAVFQSLPSNIQRVFAGVGSWLVGQGRALIQGFIDGINSMVREVGSAVNNVLDWAAGFFPHSPAKRGVFSGAGWTAVSDGGASLMEQFALGAEAFKPEVSFSNMTALVGAASDARGGDTYVQNPWTGEYLLARAQTVADGRIGSYDNSLSQTIRRGVRTA